MSRRRRASKLTGDWFQTGAAVPTVVGLRLARMAEPPNLANWFEFHRMVFEKWAAGIEAVQAMNAELMQRQFELGLRLLPSMAGGWMNLGGQWQRTGEAVMLAGLQPVKKRVVANRRRLVRQANPATRAPKRRG